MSKNYRIENPQEELRKILHTELGKEAHEYLELPGEYNGPEPCERPDDDKELPPTYLNYYTYYEEFGELINSIFYEDYEVNEDIIEKDHILGTVFSHHFFKKKTLIIITQLPLSECTRRYENLSTIICPVIRSFADYDGIEHLEMIKEKISEDECFENVDALDILFVMKNCKKNHRKVLKELCESFSQMKITDASFKEKLKKAMRCVIHQYGETNDEIKELEGIIGWES